MKAPNVSRFFAKMTLPLIMMGLGHSAMAQDYYQIKKSQGIKHNKENQYRAEMASYDQQIKVNHKAALMPSDGTGILYLKGIESPDDKIIEGVRYTNFIGSAEKKTQSMINAFDNNKLKIVGSARTGVALSDAIYETKKLGEQVKDGIVMFVNAHGFGQKMPDKMDKGFYTSENRMIFDRSSVVYNDDGTVRDMHFDKDTIDSKVMYDKIAEAFKNDPNLTGKKLSIIAGPCEDYDANFTQLPPGSQVLLYNDHNKYTWGVGYNTSMELPFMGNKKLVGNNSNLLVAAMLNANKGLEAEPQKRNNFKMVTIVDKAPDKVTLDTLGKKHTFSNEGHYAAVIDPVEDIFRLKKMKISDEELASDFKKHTDDLLTDVQRQRMMETWKQVNDGTDLECLAMDQRDGIFVMAYSYLAEHPKLQISWLQHQFKHGAKGFEQAPINLAKQQQVLVASAPKAK